MQKPHVILGWSSGLRPLSLIRLLHERAGYSPAKAAQWVSVLTPELNSFAAVHWSTREEAAEFAEAARKCGASASVSPSADGEKGESL